VDEFPHPTVTDQRPAAAASSSTVPTVPMTPRAASGEGQRSPAPRQVPLRVELARREGLKRAWSAQAPCADRARTASPPIAQAAFKTDRVPSKAGNDDTPSQRAMADARAHKNPNGGRSHPPGLCLRLPQTHLGPSLGHFARTPAPLPALSRLSLAFPGFPWPFRDLSRALSEPSPGTLPLTLLTGLFITVADADRAPLTGDEVGAGWFGPNPTDDRQKLRKICSTGVR
jgi:hypothetical protein